MKNDTNRGARRGRGDDGVTIILFALAMVAILVVVAIVIDFGVVRSSRQSNKLSTDVAATAGLQSLAPDGTPNPWQAVCKSLDYLEINEPDLVPFTLTYQDGAGNAIGGNPCTDAVRLAQQCTPNTAATWAWIRAVSGDRAFDIKSGYALPDPAFPEDNAEYDGDDGDPAQGGCDHLAVLTLRTDDAYFGGIAGRTSYDTVARTVGRVAVAADATGNPAFLMLERKGCNTLSEQVGTSELGIIVDAADADNPGFIHVDSKGDPATGCNGNNNADGWAVYGDDSTSPKIVARPTSTGIPGTIAVHAMQVGTPPTAYAASTAAGIEPDPTPGPIVSRKPIDNKYNSSGEPSIADLHSEAVQYVSGTTAPPATYPAVRPGAWTTWTSCGGTPPAGTKIFVNCTSGFAAANPTNFATATDVVFNGPVSVANNRALFFPSARRIIVGGTTNGGLAVSGGGRLGVNSAAFANASTPYLACSGREGPGWTQTTELVIFGGRGSGGDQGALNVTGGGALCQTFVYLAGPKNLTTYAARQITNGTYDSTCTASKPCPLTTGNPISDAHLVVGGHLQWSAPNQLTVQPTPGSVGFEDLALWGETATLSELKSGGDLRARGVYFLPNDRMEFRSPASATPQDAQFISRSLGLLQGTLRMQPTPSNVVQVPLLDGSGLVR